MIARRERQVDISIYCLDLQFLDIESQIYAYQNNTFISLLPLAEFTLCSETSRYQNLLIDTSDFRNGAKYHRTPAFDNQEII